MTNKVPIVSIDKTDGAMLYLSENSLETLIVSAKSSEMNILVPRADGEFVRKVSQHESNPKPDPNPNPNPKTKEMKSL